MRKFDEQVFDAGFSLNGSALVEAGAGTGKTYQIQNAFLRLALSEGLPVESILVVTFTEAATSELRGRLREIIANCMARMNGADTDDNDRLDKALALPLAGFEENEAKRNEQKRRLGFALMDFDKTSICTIHGFCNRVLERYAFECGHDPDAELLADDKEIVRDICQNWWRRHGYVPANQAGRLFKNPQELCRLVGEALKRPEARLEPTDDPQNSGEPPRELRPTLESIHALAQELVNERMLEPSRAAGEWMKEVQAFLTNAADAPPTFAITEKAGEACWTVKATLPEAVSKLRETCRNSKGEGRLDSRTAAWDGEHAIRPNKSAEPVSVENLLQILNESGRDIANWLTTLPAPLWNDASDDQAAKSAIKFLCDIPIAQRQTISARDFLGHVRAIANSAGRSLLRSKMTAKELHPEWDACARLAEAARQTAKLAVIRDLRKAMAQAIRKRQALTYDGMLEGVREALSDPDRGPALRRVLREEYSAAMIDEFQDTDSTQYNIFREIFTDKEGESANKPFLLVGDPKQAIYAFRGGDIFTYFSARETVPEERRLRLPVNYRSVPGLVAAVNALFVDQDSAPGFATEKIGFTPATAWHAAQDDVPQPMKIWQYNYTQALKKQQRTSSKAPARNSDFMRHVLARVAEQIVELLASARHQNQAAVQPRDIAVLVLTRDEADAIGAELDKRKVPFVKQSVGHVFDSEEARSVVRFMRAMLNPNQPEIVRTALAEKTVPCPEEALRCFASGENEKPAMLPENLQRLENWMESLEEAGRLWKRRSFIEAYGLLEKKWGLRAHVAGLPDGEQRLANLFQIADLAHRAARARRLGPESLLRWTTLQLDKSSRDADENAERQPATDESAVRIMTVFKSKGLQFPIVFAPTLWRRSSTDSGGPSSPLLFYHDDHDQPVLNLDKKNEEAKARQIAERHEENHRLIYVALTRATHRCYAVSVNLGEANRYAWNRILERCPPEPPSIAFDAIEVDAPLPDVPCTTWSAKQPIPKPADLRTAGLPQVDKTHGISSFSALIRSEAVEKPDSAGQDRDEPDNEESDDSMESPLPVEPAPIFWIGGGARTGNCWHDILEQADFQANDNQLNALVAEKLDRTRICKDRLPEREQRKRDAVQAMIHATLDAKLEAHGSSFTLRDIPMSARRSELAFDLALRQTGEHRTVHALAMAARDHWLAPARDDRFLDALQERTSSVPLGFLTGFMDLVFQHNNRFYIADWKSNRLDGDLRNFEPPGLRREMSRHFYYLQYMIYAVALDAWLRQQLDGYDFNNHFGGVFYFFLRGTQANTARGILYDPLSKPLIAALSETLSGKRQLCVHSMVAKTRKL